MAKILSVGPDHDKLVVRSKALKDRGHHVRTAETRSDALDLARSGVFEIILVCDCFLPAYATHLADELHIVAPRTAILVLAGRSSALTTAEIHSFIVRQIPTTAVA